MYKTFAILTATLLSTSMAAAQTASTSTPAPQKPTTFVGCLEQSQRAATAESGAFVLNTPTPVASAEMRKGTPEDPASNARATVPPLDAGDTGRAEGKLANVYVLDGPTTELSKHIGHKVEITGTLKPVTDTATSSPASAGARTAVPHLQVAGIKMVAASCSGN
jgi:hypothetical protein